MLSSDSATAEQSGIPSRPPDSNAALRRLAWRCVGLAYVFCLVGFIVANRGAFWSWFKLWAFAGHDYGFLILAASGWLIWRCRYRLREIAPAPDWSGLLLVAPLAVGLWLAYLVDVRIVQLVLLVVGIAALVWTVLGAAVLRVVAYPIALLFLALPIWNYARPVLQELTVRATVLALQITGLPVFVDETYINIPGRAIVVLAECSGAQFFQAGLTIGTLYAYLNFRLLSLRLLMLGGFVLLSIAGNWIRVYTLVFLGPLTEFQHFMVGWGIFTVLLTIAFAGGMRLQRYEDSRPRRDAAVEPRDPNATAYVRPSLASVIGVTVAMWLLAIGPVVAARSVASMPGPVEALKPITVQSPWSGPYSPREDWQPSFEHADTRSMAAYRAGDREVTSYWAYYARQSQGVEVVNELNSLYDSRWARRGGYAGTDYVAVHLEGGDTLSIVETRLQDRETGAERLVWHWYSIAGRNVVQPWHAKLVQILGLAYGRRDAMVIALSTEVADIDEARDLLRRFVRSNEAALMAVSSGVRS